MNGATKKTVQSPSEAPACLHIPETVWLDGVLMLRGGRKPYLTDFPEPIPCSHANNFLSV
jgi:hypothetical protein